MTPKEKAQELVDKYLCIDETYNVDLFCDQCGMSNEAAKYCALIAVDEIVNCDNYFNTLADAKEFINYWYEVQQEIEQL